MKCLSSFKVTKRRVLLCSARSSGKFSIVGLKFAAAAVIKATEAFHEVCLGHDHLVTSALFIVYKFINTGE